MVLDEKKKKLVEDIGFITNGNAYIKFNDDQNWPIDYVRLDDKVYSNKEKMANNIIKYAENVRKAIDMVNSYETIDDLGPHIPSFIIKYHPAWIYLRESYGFTNPKEDEILCQKESMPNTFDYFYKNNFLALGFNAPYNDKIKKDAVMTYEVFESLFPIEKLREISQTQNYNHPDFEAFQTAVNYKIQIDSYNEMMENNIDPKRLPIQYKAVNYRLGEDGFPLLTVGSNKNKKTFDFRKEKDYRGFVITLAKKNPKSEAGMQYKKLLKTRRNG